MQRCIAVAGGNDFHIKQLFRKFFLESALILILPFTSGLSYLQASLQVYNQIVWTNIGGEREVFVAELLVHECHSTPRCG